ncbi:hypothetical protein QR680_005509 [Steinernema hermaphroditum]|uniref:Uncharacterized protein n=1 Tax=Steinernema hermaphroditum TaxID=289476 RepID=A0AA39HTP7_9BILA|nr:hypothetical protein QR680_005509 [Steinernema hermaphroditum]
MMDRGPIASRRCRGSEQMYATPTQRQAFRQDTDNKEEEQQGKKKPGHLFFRTTANKEAANRGWRRSYLFAPKEYPPEADKSILVQIIAPKSFCTTPKTTSTFDAQSPQWCDTETRQPPRRHS